jgi:hypothetical protein
MPDYKIRYKEGNRTQLVTADKYELANGYFIFEKDGADILHVTAKDVESVGAADISDPEAPPPVFA